MDELDKGLDISLKGKARDSALDAFRKQVDAWGIALPPVEPLVLDFGLGRFHEIGMIEYWIANEIEAGYCGKYMFVFDGQTCPMHHHHEKMETFFIVRGTVRMILDGSERRMAAGDVLPVRPGQKHSFSGIGPALLLELSKPCIIADNVFEDQRIGELRAGIEEPRMDTNAHE
jgi:mannose-6-phosphate isomerase-like protein (cupin superfamily)